MTIFTHYKKQSATKPSSNPPLPSLLTPNNYTYIGSYTTSPFGSYFWNKWNSPLLNRKIGIEVKFSGWLTLNGKYVFYHTQALKEIKHLFQIKIKKHEIEFFKNIFEIAEQKFLSAIRFANGLMFNYSRVAHDFNSMIQEAQKIISFWCIGWHLSRIIDEFLEDITKQCNLKPGELAKQIPNFKTPLTQQQKEMRLLKSLLKSQKIWHSNLQKTEKLILSSPQLLKQFNKHLKKYNWILNIDWNGKKLTLRKVLEFMKNIKQPEILIERPQKNGHESLFKEYYPILEAASINQLGSEYLSIFADKVSDFLLKTAHRLSLSKAEFHLLTPSEILKALTNHNNIKKLYIKIGRRKNNNWCTYADNDNLTKIIDNPVLVNILHQKFIPKFVNQKKNYIKGKTGNKGKARGVVKIVISAKELAKVEQNDILVAPMTTPNFILAMQKASAIITDMGGMLSHAAIISRELQKPCIIETKTATKILKDGDFVEVDATRGEVKILKK